MNKDRLNGELRQEPGDVSRVRMAVKLQEVFALPGASERVAALGSLIATLAAPLQDGRSVSDDYYELLASLTRLHKLEKSHASIEQLLRPTA